MSWLIIDRSPSSLWTPQYLAGDPDQYMEGYWAWASKQDRAILQAALFHDYCIQFPALISLNNVPKFVC